MQIIVTAGAQPGESASAACPVCGHDYLLDALEPGQDGRMVTVSCSCGENFLAVADVRRSERHPVAIRGMYTVMSDSGLGGMVTLKDISEGGVGFTLAAPCALKPGWLITLVFELTGKEKRVIVAKATIRSVHGRDVGCAFLNPEQVRQDILAYFQCPA